MKKHLSILLSAAVAAAISPASAATVSYWQLDETSGNLVDAVGSNNLSSGTDLTYSQAALVNPVPNPDATVGGFNPNSISFSSATLAPSTSTVAPFALTASSSFTFEGFFQHNITDGSQSGIENIGGDRQGQSTDNEGVFFRGWHVNFNSGAVQFFYSDNNAAGDAQQSFSVTSGAGLDDGGVHHFAAVWDHSTGTATEGTMTLYVNGGLVGTGNVTGLDDYTSSGFTIGGRSTTSANNDFDDGLFNGTLDELRFSDEVLAPSQFLNVPEPSSFAVLGGCLGLACVMRRRRQG